MVVRFFSLKAHVLKTLRPAALAAVMALRTSGGDWDLSVLRFRRGI